MFLGKSPARYLPVPVPPFNQVYINGCRRIKCWGQPCDGLASYEIQGGEEILLVASYYRSRDKLRPDAGPLDLSVGRLRPRANVESKSNLIRRTCLF